MITIVTIDGPAGSGKSTSARLLSERLGLPYLDTGSLYRAVAWLCNYFGCDLTDDDACGAIARDMQVRIPGPSQIIVGCRQIEERDISLAIRAPEASRGSSLVGALPSVRETLMEFQRQFGDEYGCVIEGRDTGTVIFPSANIKFWLTASNDVRVARVQAEKGFEIAAQIAERDHREATRTVAPMIPADNAHHIDSTGRSIEEVVDEMESVVRDVMRNLPNTH